MRVRTPAADWDPSQPHPDPRRERAAQMLANGESAAATYRATIATKEVVDGTARTNGMHLSRESAIVSRVQAIRAERARLVEQIDTFNHGDLAEVMGEVVEALEAAYQAAQRTGASPMQLGKIRNALVVHTNRVGDLEAAPAPVIATGGVDVEERLAALPWCTCDD